MKSARVRLTKEHFVLSTVNPWRLDMTNTRMLIRDVSNLENAHTADIGDEIAFRSSFRSRRWVKYEESKPEYSTEKATFDRIALFHIWFEYN